MASNDLSDAIVEAHRAFEDDPKKAAALQKVLTSFLDRLRDTENKSDELERKIASVGRDLASLTKSINESDR